MMSIIKLGASMALICSALVAAAPTTQAVALAKRDAPGCTDSSFTDAALGALNAHRSVHGAPAFTYDATLAKYAQGVSDTCQMVHSGGPYGENLYEIMPGVSGSWADATTSAIWDWAVEIRKYNFDSPGFSETTGHATALLWKTATKVGCAWTACDGLALFTCEFDESVPNMEGEYEQNVFPLGTSV